MYYQHFDVSMFQTTKDDNHEQEAVKTGKPGLLDRLLASIGSLLFGADQESSVQDGEVTDPQQSEAEPISYYLIYFPEYYDVGLYWLDF